MAERLTRKIFDKIGKQQDIYEWSSVSSLECNKKLGKLEDIMEKYDIESVEELDKILSWLYTLSGQDIELMKFIAQGRKQIHDMYCKIKKDRDTWKRACELMGKKFLELYCSDYCGNHKDCNNCVFKKTTNPQYFYKQAKKEQQ